MLDVGAGRGVRNRDRQRPHRPTRRGCRCRRTRSRLSGSRCRCPASCRRAATEGSVPDTCRRPGLCRRDSSGRCRRGRACRSSRPRSTCGRRSFLANLSAISLCSHALLRDGQLGPALERALRRGLGVEREGDVVLGPVGGLDLEPRGGREARTVDAVDQLVLRVAVQVLGRDLAELAIRDAGLGLGHLDARDDADVVLGLRLAEQRPRGLEALVRDARAPACVAARFQ